MRTPDQVVADLRKAEKAVEEAQANVVRFQAELREMAEYLGKEMAPKVVQAVAIAA